MRGPRIWAGGALALGLMAGGVEAPLHAQQAAAPAATPVAVPTSAPATLVADKVHVGGDKSLTAEGHVEVFYKGARLTASKIVYDKAADKLVITGPIRLTDAAGTVLVADSAELSADLRNGILTSARMVLDRQLQLAAAQINRVDGRYTQLTHTVASSCRVCAARPTPLWEIRASRVVHDNLDHQLYFDNATLRIAGVPIFYLPRLRMPDPSLTRASGFLVPSFRNSSLFGAGFGIPYFFKLGDSRDLTLSPFIAERARTLGLRYRQAFRNGALIANGAITRDDLHPGATRGYLFANGEFLLRDGYKLSFDIQSVSDASYLSDYGISGIDRLQSDIALTRTTRSDFTQLKAYGFHSIRPSDDNATLPRWAAGATRIHRFSPGLIGGQATLSFDSFAFTRDTAVTGLGGDLLRASARLDWRRSWVVGPGIVATTMARVTSEVYAISDYQPGTITRTIPEAALELRWPLVKAERGGATQVLEPIVQFIVAPRTVASVPNQDSTSVAFDEGDLWSLDRAPGYDVIETGPRANVGLRWTRIAPSGASLGVVAGRVFRAVSAQDFTTSSGLGGARSDWLTGVRWSSPTGIVLTGRAVFNDHFSVSKAEGVMGWQSARLALATSYTWLVADPAENRTDETKEWAMDASWQMSDSWRGNLSWRYDFVAQRATSAGLGLNWRNECLSVDLSLSRSFTSSTSVTATTNLGLSVNLLGISGQAAGTTGGACRG